MKEEAVNKGNSADNPMVSDAMNAEEQALGHLVRMAHRRQRAACPDLDEEWAAFRRAHVEGADSPQSEAPDATGRHSDDAQMAESDWATSAPAPASTPVSTPTSIVPRREATNRETSNREATNRVFPRHEARRFTAWHLTLAVLSGAAAMLALVFLLRGIVFPTADNGSTGLIALGYDEGPQAISLHEGDSAVAVEPSLDSLSFRTQAGTKSVVVAQAQAVKPRPKRLSTPRGMDFKVILPDGSEVWLNAESTIEFPSTFLSGERRVTLEGEAYFKVAHDQEAPFVVSTKGMDVRVLGTEFNLKSYATSPTHVALVEGSVEVLRPGADQAAATLEPGREAWFDGEGQVQVQPVDVYAVTQWVKGFFYFDDSPLLDVLRDLGRWYNLGVIFRNPQAMSCQVHFSALRTGDIDLAIESLNRLRKFKVVLEDNNIVVY